MYPRSTRCTVNICAEPSKYSLHNNCKACSKAVLPQLYEHIIRGYSHASSSVRLSSGTAVLFVKEIILHFGKFILILLLVHLMAFYMSIFPQCLVLPLQYCLTLFHPANALSIIIYFFIYDFGRFSPPYTPCSDYKIR